MNKIEKINSYVGTTPNEIFSNIKEASSGTGDRLVILKLYNKIIILRANPLETNFNRLPFWNFYWSDFTETGKHPSEPIWNDIPLDSSTFPPRSILKNLTEFYEIRKPKEVETFLNNNNYLVNFLLKVRTEIIKYFPEEKLFLEVISDPETNDEKELVIYINTSLSPSEAINKLDQFDEGWWLDASFEVVRRLCIHLEYK